MRAKIIKLSKQIVSVILALGALASAILAVIQLSEYFNKDALVEYDSPFIPLVYEEVVDFRKFLDENAGKRVKFETEISFDSVLAVSLMAHEVCNYDDFLESVHNNPSNIENTTLGILNFEDGFIDPQEIYFYDSKKERYDFGENSLSKLSCYDTLRIKMKDPSRLRLSYGGTGTMSLPLYGEFMIEVRYFSGPSTEYTLREL